MGNKGCKMYCYQRSTRPSLQHPGLTAKWSLTIVKGVTEYTGSYALVVEGTALQPCRASTCRQARGCSTGTSISAHALRSMFFPTMFLVNLSTTRRLNAKECQ